MAYNKNELSHLVSDGLEDYNDEDKNQQHAQLQQLTRWKTISLFLLFTLILTYGMALLDGQEGALRNKKHGNCMFCHLQSQPTLHEDKSYNILVLGNNNDKEDTAATVVPMTITYNYELYDGQLLFTNPESELIPNLEFDYAIVGMNGIRNINRDTGKLVSLDEVYFHHFTFFPLNMVGAEVLTRDASDPYVKFPEGYALHVFYEDSPTIKINAHLLSNKNLAPIDGSMALAHKHCNECYYAPGKGSDCTPAFEGTFKCCGDSESCTISGGLCGCATNDDDNESSLLQHSNNNNNNDMSKKKKVTRYQVQADILISRDIGKFHRVDQWTFAAPACFKNLDGKASFNEYALDNYCNDTKLGTEGSLFHQIEEQEDDQPYVETRISSIAPTSGKIVWAQSHLHTGGVNATLRLNGDIICSTGTTYGTGIDKQSNIFNEQNHLIKIDSCYDTPIFKDGGIEFKEGDVLTTESIYNGSINDERFVGYRAAGEHKNVMSMFFLGVVFDGNTRYAKEKRTSFNGFGDITYSFGLQESSPYE
eukprot:CAMPEP_0170841298 /NCGR_PEP_ID=MMETSP0734-20130129/5094_1 /TAXON_ID=186038 /ORGANISM="Fragilariopsis kerguelensis, Strain L26-C5" /LENGTH=534 /DNA_ID=CAMNT_0011209279 /DNA_START=174 /DNA_END=1778 /DNA_ORIENTATION=-